MHIFNRKQITDSLVKEIVGLYNQNYSIKDIEQEKDMFHNEIVSILYIGKVPFDLLGPEIPSLDFDKNKTVFASDHHIGSWQERLEYASYLNAFALNRKITDVFVLGDFFHGLMHKVSYEIQSPEELITYVVENYPYNENITVHILFGNHEHELLRYHPELIDILKTRDDFDLLGFKQAIIRWKGKNISLFHSTERYDVPFPNVMSVVAQIEGHHHRVKIKDKKIYLPPLSDLFTIEGNNEVLPGFIFGKINDSELKLSLAEIEYDKTYNRGPILTKSFENKVD